MWSSYFHFCYQSCQVWKRLTKGLKIQSVVALMSFIPTFDTYVDVSTSNSHIFGKGPRQTFQGKLVDCNPQESVQAVFQQVLRVVSQAVLILVRDFLIFFSIIKTLTSPVTSQIRSYT